MRKSLFALENDGEVADVEMSVSPEEGQIADAGNEVGDDLGDIGETAEAVETGADAGEQLGEVEELVEDAVENGEGLDPVAAEAVRISVEAICARIGANPRSVYSLYATENFQSASSRKANSRIALEGVGEFLKNLYEKIKAALTNMWTKIKAFWAKHISTLGRVKKALEAMKAKVSSSSGKLKGSAQIDEAPSSLVDAFAGTGSLNTSVITKFIATHSKATGTSKNVTDSVTKYNAVVNPVAGTAAVDGSAVKEIFKEKKLGENSAPLVGGVWIEYKVEGGEDKDDAVNIVVTRETISDKDTKRPLIMTDKGEVKTLLDGTLAVINETIKIKDNVSKLHDATTKMLNEFEKSVNKANPTGNGFKGSRAALSKAYKVNSKAGMVSGEMLNQNIRLAKAVMGYASVCLKNYS